MCNTNTVELDEKYILGTKKGHNSLKTILTTPTDEFTQIPNAEVIETPHGPLIYIDNGGNILGVGHLDTVMETKPKFIRKDNDLAINSPQLDDRLGVWSLLLGLNHLVDKPYDILLTDSEEIGQSTAQYFKQSFPDHKEYNWGFEIDRNGNDCALYDYYGNELQEVLEMEGWKCSIGSFTDICNLTDCGFQCVNFGIEYHQQHTEQCYAKIDKVNIQLERIASFVNKYADSSFPFDETKDSYNNYGGFGFGYHGTSIKTPTKIRSYDYDDWNTYGNNLDFSDENEKWVKNNYGQWFCCNKFMHCDDWGWIDSDWSYCPYCGTAVNEFLL